MSIREMQKYSLKSKIASILVSIFAFFAFSFNFVSAESLTYRKERIDPYTIDMNVGLSDSAKQGSYRSGEDVTADVKINNRGDYCLLDGALVYNLIALGGIPGTALIKDPNAYKNNENIINEETKPLVSCPGEETTLPISVKLPADLRGGDYRIDFYIRSPRAEVNGRHEIYSTVNQLRFKVLGDGSFPQAKIVPSQTTFAGSSYQKGAMVLPNYDQASFVEVLNQDINEPFIGKLLTTICVFNKFSGLRCEKSTSQDISVPPGSAKKFRTDIRVDLKPDAYSISYKLTDKDGRINSNWNNRFIVSGHEASIYAMASDKLSYVEGDKITILASIGGPYGLADSAAFASDISFKAELFDTSGIYAKRIFSKEGTYPAIGADSQAKFQEVVSAGSDITSFRLCGTLRDKDKVLESRCVSAGESRAVLSVSGSGIVMIIAFLLLLWLMAYFVIKKRININTALFIFFMIATAVFVYSYVNRAEANISGVAAPFLNKNGVWGDKCSNVSFYFDRDPDPDERIDLAKGDDDNKYYIPQNTIVRLQKPDWGTISEPHSCTKQVTKVTPPDVQVTHCSYAFILGQSATPTAQVIYKEVSGQYKTNYDNALIAADGAYNAAEAAADGVRTATNNTYVGTHATAVQNLINFAKTLGSSVAYQSAIDSGVDVYDTAKNALDYTYGTKADAAYSTYQIARDAAIEKVFTDASIARAASVEKINAIYNKGYTAAENAFSSTWCTYWNVRDYIKWPNCNFPHEDGNQVAGDPKFEGRYAADKSAIGNVALGSADCDPDVYCTSPSGNNGSLYWQVANAHYLAVTSNSATDSNVPSILQKAYDDAIPAIDAIYAEATSDDAKYGAIAKATAPADEALRTALKNAGDDYRRDLGTLDGFVAAANVGPPDAEGTYQEAVATANGIRNAAIAAASATYAGSYNGAKTASDTSFRNDVQKAVNDDIAANLADAASFLAKIKAKMEESKARCRALIASGVDTEQIPGLVGADLLGLKSLISDMSANLSANLPGETSIETKTVSFPRSINLNTSEFAGCLPAVPVVGCSGGEPIVTSDSGQFPNPVMDITESDAGGIPTFVSESKYVVTITAQDMIDAINNNTYSSPSMDSASKTTIADPSLSAIDVPSTADLNSSGDLSYIDSFIGLDINVPPRLPAQIFHNFSQRVTGVADAGTGRTFADLPEEYALIASVFQPILSLFNILK